MPKLTFFFLMYSITHSSFKPASEHLRQVLLFVYNNNIKKRRRRNADKNESTPHTMQKKTIIIYINISLSIRINNKRRINNDIDIHTSKNDA